MFTGRIVVRRNENWFCPGYWLRAVCRDTPTFCSTHQQRQLYDLFVNYNMCNNISFSTIQTNKPVLKKRFFCQFIDICVFSARLTRVFQYFIILNS